MKKYLFTPFIGLWLLAIASPAPAQLHVPAAPAMVVAAVVAGSTVTPAASSAATPDTAAKLTPAPPSGADSPFPAEARELWSGDLYTSTYRAGVCIAPDGKVRGVLLLRTMGGKTDTYHFFGNLEDGIVRATHGSGHSFRGSFPAADVIQGTITLKSGRSITLTGKREQGVELTESCRPLPE